MSQGMLMEKKPLTTTTQTHNPLIQLLTGPYKMILFQGIYEGSLNDKRLLHFSISEVAISMSDFTLRILHYAYASKDKLKFPL